MNTKRLFASLALAIPAITLAQPIDNTEPSKPCSQSRASQTYWAKQHTSLVAHGTAVLKDGNLDDAKASLDSAGLAARMACMKETKASQALDRSIAQVEINDAMIKSARQVAAHDYSRASNMLRSIARFAKDMKLEVPESHPVLVRTANIGIVEHFFAELYAQVQTKKMSSEQAAERAKLVCQRNIPQLGISMPEQCKQYMK